MTDDVRLSVGLSTHHKTRKLKRRLGAAGCWSLVVLFLWTGAQRWDGTLHGMSDEDIELAADWDGEPGALVDALLEVGFLDGEPGRRVIHDWQEHNPYAASKGQRIEKGKKAASARWHSKESKAEHATSMPVASAEHASSTAEQCPPAPAPSPAHHVTAKATVEPSVRQPDRFPEFWDAYPNKQGKQEAWKRWRKDKLDALADRILAHVARMRAEDDGWQRGFAPMGSTYLNQARWTDEPRAAPRPDGAPVAAPSKPREYGAAAAMRATESPYERAVGHINQQHRLGLITDEQRTEQLVAARDKHSRREPVTV